MNSLILASFLALHWGMPQGPSNLATVNGTVMAIDTAANTITVRLPNSWENIVNYSSKTTLYGSDGLIAAGPQSLKAGNQVIVHYSIHGDDLELAAVEIDQIGAGGMKGVSGTVLSLDRVGKKLAVKGSDGSEQSFTLTDSAAMDAISQGKVKGKVEGKKAGTETASIQGPVTVYFAQEGGAKVAHYVDKPLEEE